MSGRSGNNLISSFCKKRALFYCGNRNFRNNTFNTDNNQSIVI
jgi:hypothetical protein